MNKKIIDFFKRIEDVCDPQLHLVSDDIKEIFIIHTYNVNEY